MDGCSNFPKWQSGRVKNYFSGLQSPCFVPVLPLLSVGKLKSKLNFTVTITKTAFSGPIDIFPYVPFLTVYLIPVSATDPLVWLIITLHMDDYSHLQGGFHCFLPRTLLLTYFLALLPSVAPYDPQWHFSKCRIKNCTLGNAVAHSSALKDPQLEVSTCRGTAGKKLV